jgi:hypothetical protein
MKAPTRKEAAALAAQDGAGAAESHRGDWWAMLPLRDRQRAVGVAGMPAERAAMPLATFTDAEREHVRLAISVHVTKMQVIAQCMAASNTNVQGWLH